MFVSSLIMNVVTMFEMPGGGLGGGAGDGLGGGAGDGGERGAGRHRAESCGSRSAYTYREKFCENISKGGEGEKKGAEVG